MSEYLQVEAVDPRYPVGRFKKPESIDVHDRMAAIATIASMPGLLMEALHGLSPEQLDTPYREGGWTVRQLVHHIADSHMNTFLRVRLALTENWPVICAYDEKAWAMLRDSMAAPVSWSVAIVENIHARWVVVLESLSEDEWKRGYKHPERGPSTLEEATLLYAWHSRHHVAHIMRLREMEGWEFGG